jgi:subtilisin
VITPPTRCDANVACTFIGTGSQGQITTYAWDFGDGTTGSGATIGHTYSGTFAAQCTRSVTVRLTVTGPGGTNSTMTSVQLVNNSFCTIG